MPKPKKPGMSLVPAAAHDHQAPLVRPRARPACTLPVAVQLSIGHLEQQVGGRAALVEALSAAAETPEVARILAYIADPTYNQWTLARLCQRADIEPWQLFSAFRIAVHSRAQLLSTLETANQSLAITKEVLLTAQRHDEPCENCNGLGTLVAEPTKQEPNPSPRPCRSCNGRGTHQVAGSLEHQKMALDLIGLIKKSGGTQIAVPVTVNNAPPTSPLGSLEQLQQAVSSIIYGPRAPLGTGIEGEILVPDPAEGLEGRETMEPPETDPPLPFEDPDALPPDDQS